jgi:hypothetical protein
LVLGATTHRGIEHVLGIEHRRGSWFRVVRAPCSSRPHGRFVYGDRCLPVASGPALGWTPGLGSE